MNISSRCEYACRAIVELAHRGGQEATEPMTATEIAERRGIPEKYLVHILLQMKRAGLVRSVRGSQGGYLLARSPDDITLFDVVCAIDGPILDPLPLQDSAGEDLRPAWRQAAKAIEAAMRDITIRDILNWAAKGEMYYI